MKSPNLKLSLTMLSPNKITLKKLNNTNLLLISILMITLILVPMSQTPIEHLILTMKKKLRKR